MTKWRGYGGEDYVRGVENGQSTKVFGVVTAHPTLAVSSFPLCVAVVVVVCFARAMGDRGRHERGDAKRG